MSLCARAAEIAKQNISGDDIHGRTIQSHTVSEDVLILKFTDGTHAILRAVVEYEDDISLEWKRHASPMELFEADVIDEATWKAIQAEKAAMAEQAREAAERAEFERLRAKFEKGAEA